MFCIYLYIYYTISQHLMKMRFTIDTNTNNHEENTKMITPGRNQIYNEYFTIMQIIAFGIYYTYSYTKIPESLIDHNVSQCFLAYIVMYWAQLIGNYINIQHVKNYYGIRMSKELFDYLNPLNRFPFTLIKLSNTACFGIGIYFVTMFSPISDNNCNIYDGYDHPCTSLQIISVFTLIFLGFLGFILSIVVLAIIFTCFYSPRDAYVLWCQCLGLTCFSCIKSCLDIFRVNNDTDNLNNPINPNNSNNQNNSNNSNNPNNSNNHWLNLLRNESMRLLPISAAAPDGTCAICIDSKQDNQWITLSCNHSFHRDCIMTWFNSESQQLRSKTCPLCRTEVTLNI